MMDRIPIRRVRKPNRVRKSNEDGFILLGVIILLALFVIAMAVAAPQIAKSIQRDRDVETMHRGNQYRRAIQLYYRKFNAYPPSIEALVKTNEIRFLRKRYIDPTTGKDDWKPIMFGQNKTPMAMGFFGQPLGGTGGNVLAGTGPSGGNGINGASPISSGLGSISSSFSSDNSTNSGTTSGNSTSSTTTNGTDGSSGSSDNGFMSGQNGQTFGGGGIIGVSPASTKQSILVYKKMDHYNQWEFLYSPLQDQPVIATTSGTGVQQSGSGTGSSFGPTSTSPGGSGTPTQPTNTQDPF